MSDDQMDDELRALLLASLGIDGEGISKYDQSFVIKDAEYIYNNAIDVAIDAQGTKRAALNIWEIMQEKDYSSKMWSAHELHPQEKTLGTVDFIFAMDLLNFSFWPEGPMEEPFAVDYRGKRWSGYWSLIAVLQRALEEGIPITDPHYWQDRNECTEEALEHVFRSSTATKIPLLKERIACLREAGQILYDRFDCSFLNCIQEANCSGAALVQLLAENFETFRDQTTFDGQSVRFYKRAQILVADLWACFEGQDYGRFNDIDRITMFADYRIPQMLRNLGCLRYSPPLESHVMALKEINPGHTWEVELRGCSIWCVELIRREMLKINPKANVNAILIDFYLYDTVKEEEARGNSLAPHHRTRSIWY